MYRIINTKNGKTIGFTNAVRYIKVNPSSGCYIQCPFAEAEGIAFASTPFNLSGKTELAEGLTTVVIGEEDDGVTMSEAVSEAVTPIDEVLCDFDSDIEDIKDALCEIDELLEGVVNNE
jgi:hypothetical protein